MSFRANSGIRISFVGAGGGEAHGEGEPEEMEMVQSALVPSFGGNEVVLESKPDNLAGSWRPEDPEEDISSCELW